MLGFFKKKLTRLPVLPAPHLRALHINPIVLPVININVPAVINAPAVQPNFNFLNVLPALNVNAAEEPPMIARAIRQILQENLHRHIPINIVNPPRRPNEFHHEGIAGQNNGFVFFGEEPAENIEELAASPVP